MDFFKRPEQISSGLGLGLAVGTAIYLPRLADHYDKTIKELTSHLKVTVLEVQDLIDQRTENQSLKQEVVQLRKEVKELKLLIKDVMEAKEKQLIPMPIQVSTQSRPELDILLGTGSSISVQQTTRSEQRTVPKSGSHSHYAREEIDEEPEEIEERCEEDDEEEAFRVAALSALKRK